MAIFFHTRDIAKAELNESHNKSAYMTHRIHEIVIFTYMNFSSLR